jgi:hypothetical protein
MPTELPQIDDEAAYNAYVQAIQSMRFKQDRPANITWAEHTALKRAAEKILGVELWASGKATGLAESNRLYKLAMTRYRKSGGVMPTTEPPEKGPKLKVVTGDGGKPVKATSAAFTFSDRFRKRLVAAINQEVFAKEGAKVSSILKEQIDGVTTYANVWKARSLPWPGDEIAKLVEGWPWHPSGTAVVDALQLFFETADPSVFAETMKKDPLDNPNPQARKVMPVAKKTVKKSKLNKAKALRAAITKLYGAPPKDKAKLAKWVGDIESEAVTTAVDKQHGRQEWGTNPAAAVGAAKKALIKSGGGSADVGPKTKRVALPQKRKAAPAHSTASTNGSQIARALDLIELLGGADEAKAAIEKADKLIRKTGIAEAKEIAELLGE